MIKKWLALLGLLLILASALLGMAWQYQRTRNGFPNVEEMEFWQLVSAIGISFEQTLIISLIGLLLGLILTIPWWRERLQQEGKWWEKRDKPLDTPPRAGV